MCANPEYREWLIDRLVHRDPAVLIDFRKKELSASLVPERFRDKPTGDVIIEIDRFIHTHDDFDKGLLELARKEGKLWIPYLDGVTHINIYSKGATSLGRALSNFAPIGFQHPVEGECASVEGFWYYVKTGKQYPILKSLHGVNAKREGKKYEVVMVPDFIEQIKVAITCKIMQNEKLKEELKESTLPLLHYYHYGGNNGTYKVIPMENDRWLLDHIESIRKDLRRTD